MINFRVCFLSDALLRASAPIWVKSANGVREVRSVRRNTSNLDLPDIALVSDGKIIVGEFDDQRVKLDLDTNLLRAKDVKGEERVISFGQPV